MTAQEREENEMPEPLTAEEGLKRLLDDARYIETTLIRSSDSQSNESLYQDSMDALERLSGHLINEVAAARFRPEPPDGLRAAALKLSDRLGLLYNRRIDLEFPWEAEWKALRAALDRSSRSDAEPGLREITARLAMVNHVAGESSDCTGDDGHPWCETCWREAEEFVAPDADFAFAVEAREHLARLSGDKATEEGTDD